MRIYLASFLIDAATYSFSIALSVHAETKLGAGHWQLGKLSALSAMCYSLVCLLSGGLSDRVGSRPLAFASLGLLAATMLGATWAESYEDLLVANAFQGLFLGLFWPPIMRKLSLLSPGGKLWSTLGVFNIIWAAGVGVGTMLTPALYAAWGLGPTLWVAGGLTLATIPVLAARMPEPGGPRTPRFAEGEAVSPERARLFLRLGWIANFAAFFALVGILRVFPKISSDLRIPVEAMGVILVPLDLGKITSFAILAWYPFWHYSFGWLAGAQAVAGFTLLIAGLAQAWWLFLLVFPFLGALSGLTYFSSLYYGLNLREGEGKKSGIHETILSSGVCFGPLLCGLVGDRYKAHPGAAIVFGGMVVLLGLLVQVFLYRRGSAPVRSGALPLPTEEAAAGRSVA